jgi:lysophospholipase L1-like esterase
MLLERPPRWGTAVLVLLVIGNVGLFAFLATRPAPADGYVPQSRVAAATNSAAPSSDPAGSVPAAPSAVEVAQTPRLAVYGDGYAAGNELGGLGNAGWPALLAAQTRAELALHAVPRAGYAAAGTTGQTFLDLVRAAPVPDATVTMVVGSRNDVNGDVRQIQQNVADTISSIRSQAPATAVVIVGPVWPDGNVPASVLVVRDAVRDAAAAAGVTFIDPLVEGWFAGSAELVAGDGVSPNDAGHAYLAGVLAPFLESYLGAGGR